MSIINSDGLNTNWQLNVLRGLQSIADEVAKPLTCAEDKITICGPANGLDVNLNDGLGNPITSTVVGADTGIDVNIIGGVTLTVNLDALDDQVGIYGYTDVNDPNSVKAIKVDAAGAIAIQDNGSSITVDANDLDIRNLTFLSDKVDASGSSVKIQDALGNGLTSTVIGLDTALDVNIVGGVTLEVNLDQNNDQVQVYGSDLIAPIATDTAGHLQVDILTIPEVEIKNDLNNPIPISDAGGSITVDGSVTVSSTDLDIRNLVFATDKVDVSGSSNIAVIDGGGSLTVDANNLDIRDLTFASDKVDASGSSVKIQDGAGNALTSTVVGADTALDVNIVGGVTLEVNLDQNNDQVGVYGYNAGSPVAISVDTNGFVNTNAAVTFPTSLSVTQNALSNPWIVSGTVALDTPTLTALENITVQNGAGVAAVNIQDGGNSITVDGTVAATQSGTWTVGVNSLPAISGTVSVTQPTHDLLNTNANIQVNNTDVSSTNPVPVIQQYPAVYASSEVVTQTGTTPVVFSPGATSMSVQNLGDDNITMDTDASAGVILPPGVSITWDAPIGQRLEGFTFTGSSASSLFIVTAVIAS